MEELVYVDSDLFRKIPHIQRGQVDSSFGHCLVLLENLERRLPGGSMAERFQNTITVGCIWP
jgi:hypothetical protein